MVCNLVEERPMLLLLAKGMMKVEPTESDTRMPGGRGHLCPDVTELSCAALSCIDCNETTDILEGCSADSVQQE